MTFEFENPLRVEHHRHGNRAGAGALLADFTHFGGPVRRIQKVVGRLTGRGEIAFELLRKILLLRVGERVAEPADRRRKKIAEQPAREGVRGLLREVADDLPRPFFRFIARHRAGTVDSHCAEFRRREEGGNLFELFVEPGPVSAQNFEIGDNRLRAELLHLRTSERFAAGTAGTAAAGAGRTEPESSGEHRF